MYSCTVQCTDLQYSVQLNSALYKLKVQCRATPCTVQVYSVNECRCWYLLCTHRGVGGIKQVGKCNQVGSRDSKESNDSAVQCSDVFLL